MSNKFLNLQAGLQIFMKYPNIHFDFKHDEMYIGLVESSNIEVSKDDRKALEELGFISDKDDDNSFLFFS